MRFGEAEWAQGKDTDGSGPGDTSERGACAVLSGAGGGREGDAPVGRPNGGQDGVGDAVRHGRQPLCPQVVVLEEL